MAFILAEYQPKSIIGLTSARRYRKIQTRVGRTACSKERKCMVERRGRGEKFGFAEVEHCFRSSFFRSGTAAVGAVLCRTVNWLKRSTRA